MASNRGRIVAPAGHPAIQPSRQAHRCRCIYIFYFSICTHYYYYSYLHLDAHVHVYAYLAHNHCCVRGTLLQSFRLYQPVLTDISKQSLEVK